MKTSDIPTPEEREVEGITNTTVDHPVGAALGATGGAIAGAAAGSVGGPVGTAVGALVGALAGGAAGHATAAAISPTDEELYWSENHPDQLWAHPEDDFEDFRAAYRAGAEGAARDEGDFAAGEDEVRQRWEETKGSADIPWDRARSAAEAAWRRASRERQPQDVHG